MSLMAVFNCSFLVTLILFLLIIGLIWIHFNQKINEQNIKMNQMVYLLTTTTQEIALLRKKIGLSEPEEIIDISNPHVNEDDEKMNVSDCETDSEEDSETDSEEDSDIDSEDSETDSEVEEDKKDVVTDSSSDSEEEEENIQKIHLSELNQEGGELEIDSDECDILDLDELKNIKKIVLTEEILGEEKLEEVHLTNEEEKEVNEEKEEKEVNEVNEEKEEKQDTNEKEDYKKMSLNKLKSLVLEKKLVSDVSKLKKNELLTILGVE